MNSKLFLRGLLASTVCLFTIFGQSDRGLPLEATRTVQFNVSEGTWISVDVSPNGKTLVFDLLGQLYTLPINGGSARALTHGLAFNGQPRFSPDGTRIVYTSDHSGDQNLWTMDINGEDARQLTHSVWADGVDESPAWAPDGLTILATKVTGTAVYPPRDLVQINVATGEESNLTAATNKSESYLGGAFGASANDVYLARSEAAALTPVDSWLMHYRIEPSADRPGSVTLRPQSYPLDRFSLRMAFRPALSRDGRWLAYGSQHDVASTTCTGLRIRNLATEVERWLIPCVEDHAELNLASRDALPGYAFTPDNKAIVIAFGGKLHRVDVLTGADQQIPFTVNVNQPIGPPIAPQFAIDDSIVRVRGISHPVISPDGQRIAFSAVGKIWLADVPQGEPHRITPTPRAEASDEFNPVWSPDGNWVAFVSWSEREGGTLYRVPASGGVPERLTQEPGRYEGVSYSPDGQWLYAEYVKSAPSDFGYTVNDADSQHRAIHELVRVPATSGATTVLQKISPDFAGRAVDPQFISSDPTAVYLNQPGGLVRLTTGKPAETRPVLRALVKGARARQPDGSMASQPNVRLTIAPNGQYAVAQAPGNLYVVRLSQPLRTDTTVKSPLSIPLYEAKQPADTIVEMVPGPPGYWINWSPDSSYFCYAAGPVVTKQYIDRDGPSLLGKSEKFEIALALPADSPAGTIVLRNACIITMRGNEVIPHGDIVVRDKRIRALGPTGAIPVPPDAHVIDVSGKTILPGYIDAHNHLFLTDESVLPRLPELQGALAYGITTLRDPTGSPQWATYAERTAIGDVPGARLYSTQGIVGESSLYNHESFESFRTLLTLWSRDYQSETLKLYGVVGPRWKRELLAQGARAEGLFATNHIEGDAYMLTAVFDGFGGLEHSFNDLPIYSDVAQLLARSGIILTPTLGEVGPMSFYTQPFAHHMLIADEKMRRFLTPYRIEHLATSSVEDNLRLQHFLAQAAKIVAAGGKIGLGSHGNYTGLGAHWELWLFAKGGMSNHDVLRAGTIWSAEAIGHGADLGSLEVGKIADLQVLDANPLEDIHNTMSIHYVMQGGRLYDAANLTEVWPRTQVLDPFPWWTNLSEP